MRRTFSLGKREDGISRERALSVPGSSRQWLRRNSHVATSSASGGGSAGGGGGAPAGAASRVGSSKASGGGASNPAAGDGAGDAPAVGKPPPRGDGAGAGADEAAARAASRRSAEACWRRRASSTPSSSSRTASSGRFIRRATSWTMRALWTAFWQAATVCRTPCTMRPAASGPSGSRSWSRRKPTWKGMMPTASSSTFWNASGGFARRKESGSSPAGSEATRTGSPSASRMAAVRTAALRPAASASKSSTTLSA